MSAPFSCDRCARPMFEKRSPQLCQSCFEKNLHELKKALNHGEKPRLY
jgi:hypothetical protein